MYYLLFYDVVDDFLERRGAYRQEHLRICREARDRGELIMGGPIESPIDTAMLLFRADDPSIPEKFARGDNYVTQGVVKSWKVRRWDVVFYGEPSVVLSAAEAQKR